MPLVPLTDEETQRFYSCTCPDCGDKTFGVCIEKWDPETRISAVEYVPWSKGNRVMPVQPTSCTACGQRFLMAPDRVTRMVEA